MKIKKVLMVVLLGVGLFGFTSVAMAQGASDTKNACDYLTADDVSSILGHAGTQDSSAPGQCSYFDSQTLTLVTLKIAATHFSSEQVDSSYQQILKFAKPLDGIGDKAAVHEENKVTGLYFFKNGMYFLITTTNDQDSSKTEALAKLIVSKL